MISLPWIGGDFYRFFERSSYNGALRGRGKLEHSRLHLKAIDVYSSACRGFNHSALVNSAWITPPVLRRIKSMKHARCPSLFGGCTSNCTLFPPGIRSVSSSLRCRCRLIRFRIPAITKTTTRTEQKSTADRGRCKLQVDLRS